jgi:glycosyltransferase EpsH
MGPLVSIIVPVYNAEKYLKRCLDSLICQTLHSIEILCVNDGSTDSTSAILDEYAQKDARIKVFNQENQGPGVARNTALNNAKGKYILFCDADDTLEPEAAFECSQAMEKNNVDIVMFNSRLIEIDRKEPGKKDVQGNYLNPIQQGWEGVLNKIECYRAAAQWNLWSYCFRSDLISSYIIRFPPAYATEDIIFLNIYFMVMRSGYALERILYSYYANKGSLSDIMYFNSKRPWLGRFLLLPKIFALTIQFAARNKMIMRERYVFYWLFVWFRSRLGRRR